MSASRLFSLVAAALAAACVAAGPAAADLDAPYAELVSPAEGAVFWQGQSVQAAYGCAAGPSGAPVISCSGDVPLGAFVDTSRVGTWTFTLRAEDYFGAVTTVTHSYTVIDLTPPTVTIPSPADWATYTIGQKVTVDYSCDDGPGGSGVIACIGSLPNGAPLPTDHVGWYTVDVTAVDAALNQVHVQHVYRVEDRTPPTVSITTPAAPNGDRLPTYRLGDLVVPVYSCSDDSTLFSCVGSPSPLDTSTVGVHTFTARSQDAGGNVTTASRSYSVVYDFAGFDTPLTSFPASVKAGEPVPVKFSLHGDFGLAAVAGVTWQPASCTTLDPTGVLAGADGTLSYSAGPDRYLFAWTTQRSWVGTCARLAVALNDGTTRVAGVRFTK